MQYMFIHGLGQNSSSWDKTISFLPATADIHRPDLVEILKHKEATYENLYRSFSDYCNAVSGPLHLCGLSLGGILALNYALDYPGKAQSITLIGTQFRMPKALLRLQNIIFQFIPKNSFKAMGFQKKDFIRLASSMVDLDFSERLGHISCAALIVCGERDRPNKKAADDLARGIPNAELHLVENTGHEVNIESPKQLAALLNAFW